MNVVTNGTLLGLPGKKYRPINYQILENIIHQKKQQGLEARKKVATIQKNVKLRIDESMLKQHKLLWIKQIKRILNEQKRLISDLNVSIFENQLNQRERDLYEEIVKESNFYESQFNIFKKQTVDPVLFLRRDLKKWIDLYPSVTDIEVCLKVDEPEVVIETIDRICGNQINIMQELMEQKDKLESQLNIGPFYDQKNEELKLLKNMIITGIPEAAFSLDCPDEELKISVLQEFIQLDGRYVEFLQDLEAKYSSYKNPRGDWPIVDHILFVYISEIYSSFEIENKRALFFDCGRRLLLNKSRDELVEHEDLYHRYNFFCNREKQILLAWQRDRTELFNKVSIIFEDAVNACIFEMNRKESADQRKKQAKVVYDKLRIWREKKMELQQLESELEDRRRKDVEKGQGVERKKKEEAKQKIKEFRDSVNKERQMRIESEQRKMQLMQKKLAEQAANDKERIKFRENEFKIKEDMKNIKKAEEKISKLEKEELLEKIREKVRPKVEGDLLRLWSNTETWKAKLKSDEDVDFSSSNNIHTFTTDQILADPRVKLEQRLREAGVHQTTYARQALATTKPLHPPRKDMISNVVLKDD